MNNNIFDLLKKNAYKINIIISIILIIGMFTYTFLGTLELYNMSLYHYCIIAIVICLSLINIINPHKKVNEYYSLIIYHICVWLLYTSFYFNITLLLIIPIFVSFLCFKKRNLIIYSSISLMILIIIRNIIYSKNFNNSVLEIIGFILINCIIYTIYIIFYNIINAILNNTYDAYKEQEITIMTLAKVIENFSDNTGFHIKRVAEYSAILFKELGYVDNQIRQYKLASMLHDFGKILIPKDILNKPSLLTNEESIIMKKHTDFGRDLLNSSESELLRIASVIAYEHHENYDGTGYHKMYGEEINVISQCVSISDYFDALTSVRPYKIAFSINEAFTMIKENEHKKFSSRIVDIFFKKSEEIISIYNKYNDKKADYE